MRIAPLPVTDVIWENAPEPVAAPAAAVAASVVTATGSAPDETPEVREEEVPAAVTNPAAEIVNWLRGEFDGVHQRLEALSERLYRHEEAVRAMAEGRAEELGVSLAELEGAAGRLKAEAASLEEMRAALVESIPQAASEAAGEAASEAVAPALAETAARAVAEVRSAVAELGAALAESLPAAVAHSLPPLSGAPAPSLVAAPGAAEPAVLGAEADTDLVSQLHEAQDEAAEWFTIVVDEAVRRAVERHLGPVTASSAATPPGPAGPVTASSAATPPGPAGPAAITGAAPADVRTAEPPAAGGGVREVLPEEPVVVESRREAQVEAQAERTAAVPSPAVDPPASSAAVVDAGVPDPASSQTAVETLVADLGLAPSGVAGNGAPAPVEDAPPATSVWDDDEEEDEADSGRDSSVACVLPGVAVGPTLAVGVSDALRRSRLRRRRRRPARVPTAGLHRQDPFAGELSLNLERFALARRNLAFSADGQGEADGATSAANMMLAAAEAGDREIALDLTEGSLALVGPGAADAGRALVTTFLTRFEPGTGRVVAVGDALPPGAEFPGLERHDDLATALDDLETELDHREKVLADGPNGDRGSSSPVILLATSSAPPYLSSRLSAVLDRGSSLGLTALGVGCELDGAAVVTLQPGAVTQSVTPEGRAHDLWGARLFTLSSGAATELLDVLSSARSDDHDATHDVEDEPFTVLTPSSVRRVGVRLLGSYRIEVDGEEIKSGLRAKARELLAFYLLHTEGTTLDVATEALWPEADPGRGSEWFWTALGNLRTTLRRATGTKALMIIERDGDRYRIEPVFDVDLWRFQAALPAAPPADSKDPAWAAALEAGAALYGGELLAGVDWAWADAPRDDLRRRALDVLVALAAMQQRAGQVERSLATLTKALDVDPLAEQLYRRIMRIHASQAAYDEVTATYRRLQVRLGELGLEPTEETARLAEELSASQ